MEPPSFHQKHSPRLNPYTPSPPRARGRTKEAGLARAGVNLNSKPETRNPKPETPNPDETRRGLVLTPNITPKLSILTPQPYTSNPEPKPLNPQPSGRTRSRRSPRRLGASWISDSWFPSPLPLYTRKRNPETQIEHALNP